MNGKRAKRLRRMATEYVVSVMKKSAGEGYGEYNQAMNMIDWEPQLTDQGHPMFDPDGMALMKPGKFPGTITNAWKVRVLYRILKKQWKDGHGQLSVA